MKLFIVNILLLTSTATGYQFKFPWSKNLVPIDRQSTQTVESSRVVAKDLRKIAASLVLTGGLFSSSITNLYPAIAADYPSIQAAESQMITLFERNVPSVVYINTFVERIDAFSMNVMEVAAGTGTGFVWDKNGHIVTNFHVIRNAGSAKVTVTSPDGKVTKTYRANVIGVDPDKDVAVLTVDAGTDALTWQPVSLGKSANLKVGQTAIAIGNPFGLDHTLTTGVISGLGREVRSPNNRPISNVIQTDASINPGNSGGPLLDSAGNLIGMNTAIFSPTGSSAGIGFAIPVDTLRYEVNSIVKDGKVVRPVLGISYLDSSQAKALGIRDGILVLGVPENSPAQLAGIKATTRGLRGNVELGDIIVGIDSDNVSSEADLLSAIEKHQVGDIVTVKLRRMVSSPDVVSSDQTIPLEVKIKLASRDAL